MTESGGGLAQHLLAQHTAMRVHQGEGGIVADSADVAEMVGDTFELSHQGAQPHGSIWNGKTQRRLDRAGED